MTFTVAGGSPLEPDVVALLEEHLSDMRRTSPPESVHALDPAALAAPSVRFVTARDADGVLLGCGAVKDLGDGTGEVKSMRTAPAARGSGVATAVLAHLVLAARDAGWRRLSLETGTQPFFEPAVRLYLRHGFRPCAPFAGYTDDPSSRYLALEL
ncbi:GNAT family N-acetyltransferase [Amnibacterium endophyticum]|uniref:GNAT family N-acetyltransferase n=1 Tax=Amnibacterium endophyticum TaxID=2109337 RepID=A0ABW4LDZ4_9MICO